MIGSSTGEQYETEYDYLIGRPLQASTEPAGALKVAEGTQVAPVDQKAIDELVAAAPNFANSPVIDQMTATAERSRPVIPEVPITGEAGKATLGPRSENTFTSEEMRKLEEKFKSKEPKPTPAEKRILEDFNRRKYSAMSQDLTDQGGADTINARPVDPSVDNFIDRYGIWNIHDRIKKMEQDEKIDQGVSLRSNKVKTIVPGTRTKRGVIS